MMLRRTGREGSTGHRQRPHTTRRSLIVVALVACTDATTPAPPPEPAFYRILTAMDSVNAAVRDFYAEGGRVQYAYLVHFPADTMMAPYVALSLKRP